MDWPERTRRRRTGDKKPEDILAAALFLVVQISLMTDPWIHLEWSGWQTCHLKHFLGSLFVLRYFSNFLLEMIVYVSHSDPGNCIFFSSHFQRNSGLGLGTSSQRLILMMYRFVTHFRSRSVCGYNSNG